MFQNMAADKPSQEDVALQFSKLTPSSSQVSFRDSNTRYEISKQLRTKC